MDGMRKYLATKTTSNEQDVALKKDEWAQKALRTFYENQRKVVGNDTVSIRSFFFVYILFLSSSLPLFFTGQFI
jgi:hypothetical protein